MSDMNAEAGAWANSPEGVKAFKAMEDRIEEQRHTPHWSYNLPDVMRVLRFDESDGVGEHGTKLIFRTRTATVLASTDPRTFGAVDTEYDGKDPKPHILYRTPGGHYVLREYYTSRAWFGSSVTDKVEAVSTEKAMELYEDMTFHGPDWEAAFDGHQFEAA